MADVTLELIQRMLQSLQENMRKIASNQDEIIVRLGRVERNTADLHGDWAAQSVRIDRVGERLERVERRLDVIGPPPAAAE